MTPKTPTPSPVPPVENQAAPANGKRYWRSLEELADTSQFEQFLHREFPEHASEMLSPFTRRTFLNLMAASAALAGLTGCRRPKQRIMPYSKMPEYMVHGRPQYYATALERGGLATGLVVECHDGRPTKVDGNPDHPDSLGATDAMTQAGVLELYDPDRSSRILNDGQASIEESFQRFMNSHVGEWRASGGQGLAFLSEVTSSPSTLALRDRIKRELPNASWHAWEPINEDAHLEGLRIALGRPMRARHDFARADVVVALDADCLLQGPGHLAQARRFMQRRREAAAHGGEGINRLYAIESYYSPTGATADNRLRLPVSGVTAFGMALAAELVARAGGSAGMALSSVLGSHLKQFVDAQWVDAVAADMMAHRGRALVVAGPTQSAEIHALAAAINELFGSECVSYAALPDENFAGVGESIRALTERMNAGQVSTLVMLGGNPVYDAPADLEFAEALGKVATSIHLGLYPNETALASTWHVPQAHGLESWGDVRATDGTVSIVQPMIEPLMGGRTAAEMMAWVAGLPERRAYDIVRGFHQGSQTAESFEMAWRQALREGTIGEKPAATNTSVNVQAVARALQNVQLGQTASRDRLELRLMADPKIHDGRYANNGWLQETPDATTKLTWDNAAIMSVATARELGLKMEDVVELEYAGAQVKLPVWLLPGMADWTVAVALGYGRTAAGRVGDGVGVNAYPLRTLAGGLHGGVGLTVTPTGEGPFELACVQDHWAIEGRELVREQIAGAGAHGEAHDEASAHEAEGEGAHTEGDGHGAAADEGSAIGTHGHKLLWKAHRYDEGPQWGMVIDLGSCIGCNACMVSCQAENNIPVVGKQQVINGREMHWIRLDRYFAGGENATIGKMSDPGVDVDEVEMVFQPMTCHHCENAPCEQVCPVAATTHSPSGINEMTYNRCIGTRYCSNNCPYKVRRFNFYNYNSPDDVNPIYMDVDKKDRALIHMAANPDVTVRSRGVMEKCTFCVQRINTATHDAKSKARGAGENEWHLADGVVKTACQQSCPTEAIIFGDLADDESKVTAAKHSPLNYTLLDYLDVRPRTSYHAKMRNPNPALTA